MLIQNVVTVHATASFSPATVVVAASGQASVAVTITQPAGFGASGAFEDDCVSVPDIVKHPGSQPMSET